jgi:hypothetical protein
MRIFISVVANLSILLKYGFEKCGRFGLATVAK